MKAVEYKRIWQEWRLLLIALCLLFILDYSFRIIFFIDTDGGPIRFSYIVGALCDATLQLLPFIWLRGKWQRLVPLPVVILSLLLFANIIYYRNFQDVIPPAMYNPMLAANSFVWDALKASCSVRDILLLFPSLIILLSAFLLPSPSASSIKGKWIYVAVTAILLAANFGLSLRRIMIYNEVNLKQSFTDYREDWGGSTTWKQSIPTYGVNGYIARIVYDTVKPAKRLSDSERQRVISTLTEKKGELPKEYASTFILNRDKNLIVIEVESMVSKALELPYATRIFPTLTSLLTDSTSISTLKMEVLAGPGRSSDAQFMLNTGLTSIQEYALINEFASAEYPSIAKALDGHFSIEVIPESGTLWQHNQTSPSYGFDTIVDKAAEEYVPDRDSLLFQRAFSLIKEIPKPFYMLITTVSTHDPYHELKVTGRQEVTNEAGKSTDLRDLNYLQALAHFDNQLALLIHTLKQKGLYENTVIAITGDHEARHSELSSLLQDHRVPLIILNSGIGKEIDYPSNQADIFPTILDVMGVNSYRPHQLPRQYRGVGSSLVRTPYHELTKDARRASTQSIETRLFR